LTNKLHLSKKSKYFVLNYRLYQIRYVGRSTNKKPAPNNLETGFQPNPIPIQVGKAMVSESLQNCLQLNLRQNWHLL